MASLDADRQRCALYAIPPHSASGERSFDRSPQNMISRPADEEVGRLHDTSSSSAPGGASSESADPERGELITSKTSTSYGPVGLMARAASTIYGWFWHSGVGATVVSSTVMAFNAAAIKVLGQPGHNVVTFEIVAARGGVCILLSLLVGGLWGMHHLKSQRKNWPVLFIRGLSGGISMALYLVAIQNLPLADAIVLFFANPALTVLLAWACLGEPLVLKAMAGIVCSLVGVVVVAQPPFLFGGHELWTKGRYIGVTCGVVSAFTSATAYVSIRKVSRTESALAIALWFHGASFLMGFSSLVTSVPDAPTAPTLIDWVLMMAVAVTSFGGQLVLGRAYQIEVASKVAAVNYLQVLYAFVFGVLLFGDPLSPLSICGAILIAAGIVTSSSSKPKPAASSSDKQAQELAALPASPEPGLPQAPLKGSQSFGSTSQHKPEPNGHVPIGSLGKQAHEADGAGSDDEGPNLGGDSIPLLPRRQS